MATFTPNSPIAAGSYNGQTLSSVVTPATYVLSGTYGSAGWGYGGIVTLFSTVSQSVGIFTPSTP